MTTCVRSQKEEIICWRFFEKKGQAEIVRNEGGVGGGRDGQQWQPDR